MSGNEKTVALVTGSRRGIGREIGLALLQDSYTVIFNGVSPALPPDLEDAARKISPDFEYFAADIGEAGARENLLKRIREKYARIDLLVNNAGIAPSQRVDLLETDLDDFQRLLEVNLTGPFFLTVDLAKHMLDFKRTHPNISDFHPKIINISSISAYSSSPNRPAYCISKAGVSMMTLLFADRLAKDGILVYEIRPGIIQTDMTSGVKDKYDTLIDGGLTPIPRWGQPTDVARAVVAISRGDFNFSTGEVFNVDGGFHFRRL